MIYNMRIYDLKPGCVPQYMDAVREVALKIRQENGVKLAGWYYTDIGKLNNGLTTIVFGHPPREQGGILNGRQGPNGRDE